MNFCDSVSAILYVWVSVQIKPNIGYKKYHFGIRFVVMNWFETHLPEGGDRIQSQKRCVL
jgi:hypothetical protein